MVEGSGKLPCGGDVLALLGEMERRAWRAAEQLPVLHRQASSWDGLIYRLGDISVVTPLDEVAEILDHPPEMTPVPGVRPWVVGIANVRGNILPVIDLESFFLDAPVKRGRRTRVLIVRDDAGATGLLVGAVGGMRHFPLEARAPADTEVLPSTLAPYVESQFVVDGERYQVLSLHALAGSAEFQMAAL